jgi:hypothetical protein
MKTRTTRVTLTKKSISDSDCFDISITDEGGGEYLVVSWGMDGNSISIDPSEWPFLRDAIDRMFVEIAENESEAKLKKLLETPAPWDTRGASGEEQDPPACDDGWILWEGGECPVKEGVRVSVRFRLSPHYDESPDKAGSFRWDHLGYSGDIIAYKVVD